MFESTPLQGEHLSALVVVILLSIILYLKPHRGVQSTRSVQRRSRFIWVQKSRLKGRLREFTCLGVGCTVILAHFWGLYQSWHYISVALVASLSAGGMCALTTFLEQKFRLRQMHSKRSGAGKSAKVHLKVFGRVSVHISAIYAICIVFSGAGDTASALGTPFLVVKSALTLAAPWGDFSATLAFAGIIFYVLSLVLTCQIFYQNNASAKAAPRTRKIRLACTMLVVFFIPTLVAAPETFPLPEAFSFQQKFTPRMVNLHQSSAQEIGTHLNALDNYRAFFSSTKLKAEVLQVKCSAESCTMPKYLTFARYQEYNGAKFSAGRGFDQVAKLQTSAPAEHTLQIILHDYPFATLPLTENTYSVRLTDPEHPLAQNAFYSKVAGTVLSAQGQISPLKYALHSENAPPVVVPSAKVQEFESAFREIITHSYLSRAYHYQSVPSAESGWLPEGVEFVPSFGGSGRGYIEKEFLAPAQSILKNEPGAAQLTLVGDEEQFSALGYLLASEFGLQARLVTGAKVPEDGTVRGENMRIWLEVRAPGSDWHSIHFEIRTDSRAKVQTSQALPLPSLLRVNSTRASSVWDADTSLANEAIVAKTSTSAPATIRSIPQWLMALLSTILALSTLSASVVYLKYRAYKCRRSKLCTQNLWDEFFLRLKRYKLPHSSACMTGTELTKHFARAAGATGQPRGVDGTRLAEFCQRFEEVCFSRDGVQKRTRNAEAKVEVEQLWQALEAILPRKWL